MPLRAARQARGEKGFGDQASCLLRAARRLQAHAPFLDDAASATSPSVKSRNLVGQPPDEAVVIGILAGRLPQFDCERLERFWLPVDGSQHVEAHHVAGAFPNRVERSLTIQARHDRFFDVAVASQAFQRLRRVLRGPLTNTELGDGRRDAGKGPFLRVAGRLVVGPRRRSMSAVAASHSIARSASTFCMAG